MTDVFVKVSPQASEPALLEYCASYLGERGYSVVAPHETWETPSKFCQRVGIRVGHFRRALDHPAAPHILTHRSRTDRVLNLLSTPLFDAFCRRNK